MCHRCFFIVELKEKEEEKKKRCKSEQKRKARTDKSRPTVFWHPLPPPLRTGLLLNRKHYPIKKKEKEKERIDNGSDDIGQHVMLHTHTHTRQNIWEEKEKEGAGRGEKGLLR